MVEYVYGLGLTLNHICVYGLRLTWFYTTIDFHYFTRQ